jgi:two-component system chemotaxis response regulator CheY
VKSTYLTLSEVSRLLDLNPSVVASWVAEGSLRATSSREGVPTFASLSLVHLLLRKGIPIPQSLNPRLRVLVVDDEAPMLRSMARLFKRAAPHLELSLAEGASDGWCAVRVQCPDVVLVDMYMPECTGIELCRRIKTLPATRGVTVIAVCGWQDAELERQFKSAGAVALLEKPLNVQHLLGVLEAESLAELAS